MTCSEASAQSREESQQGDAVLDSSQALEQFFKRVERRAYRLALLASNQHEDALDIVQDAMLKLTQKYAHKPQAEWGPLFHRIVQSTILDYYRRQKVRNQWRAFLEYTGYTQRRTGDAASGNDGDALNPIEQMQDLTAPEPASELNTEQAMSALESAIQNLPLRQQQAFLLRTWEGLSVEETADAMGCSQGSVKTHYSRAIHTLRQILEDYR